MGRAMLNICIVFAQLERETIQKRVTDAYYSRSQRGFKMGGKAPYGFHTEPIKMDGINTKRLVVNPEEAANVRLMFEMYAEPKTSYGDITRYFAEQGILFNGLNIQSKCNKIVGEKKNGQPKGKPVNWKLARTTRKE